MTTPRIGLIGGGQLAWMMGLEATRLGLEMVVQTPNATDPALQSVGDRVLAAITDLAGTRALSDRCDVITFENEFVDLSGLETLATNGTVFRPQLSALAPLLDKLTQRQFLATHGLPNPPYEVLEAATTDADLKAIASRIGFPLVLKTRRMGYDGQGTFIVRSLAELSQRWQAVGRVPALLEAYIPFDRELAIMVARSLKGDITAYPVVETQQVDQVCRRVIAPAEISREVADQAEAIAQTVVERLDFVGVLGIELFLAAGDRLLVNEIAPRTHNSGHYTLGACETSQFAQQLLAVTGYPLGSSAMTCDRALMVNLLGFEAATSDYADLRTQLAAIPQAQVYWYGKAQSRPGRKLGHVTVTLENGEDWWAIAQQIESIWYPTSKG